MLKSDKTNELIQGNYELMKDWKTCIHGYMYNINKNVSVYDDKYYKDEFDWDGTLGVCIGDKTMFNWKKGISLILNNQCKYCWRIE